MRAGVKRMTHRLLLATVLVAAAGSPVAGAAAATAVGDSAQSHASTARLARLGAVDTLRTNVWLARAVLTEIVAEVVAELPPAPGTVVVRPLLRSPANPLLIGAVEDLLAARGYTTYLDEQDIADPAKPARVLRAPAGGSELRLNCEDIRLVYPRVGRRFGLWRQWVDRELSVAVLATIVDRESGRLLYDERLTRAFGDRVPAGRFADVRSTAYAFTDAEVEEGGWRRRAEQTVVLGTLVGLVALYFANTGS